MPRRNSSNNIALACIETRHRAIDARRLQICELRYQRVALCGGEKKALAAVVVAALLHDVAFIEQLLENAAKRLLGDAQDVQKIGDLQTRVTADEVHDAMMRAAEAERGQNVIGIADKIPVGEEQQLDDVPARHGAAAASRSRAEHRWATNLCQPY